MTRFPRLEPLGTDALLVRFADGLDDGANRRAVAFRAALEADSLPGVVETASSLASVLVRFDGDAAPIEAALADRLSGSAEPRGGPAATAWTVPCAFGGGDGPQLAEVARAVGLSEADAVAALCAGPVRVLALGFAPGMPYLGILPERWDVPRQTGLTPEVPEGALVVAVRQLVLFGTKAPTGWRQVGATRFPCFRIDRDPPVALSPGDTVRFEPVARDELDARAERDPRFGGAVRGAA